MSGYALFHTKSGDSRNCQTFDLLIVFVFFSLTILPILIAYVQSKQQIVERLPLKLAMLSLFKRKVVVLRLVNVLIL